MLKCYGRGTGLMPLLQPNCGGVSARDWPEQNHFSFSTIIFHFQARCSPLTKIFFAQVCSRYVCLLEFSCPAVMFAFRLHVLPPHFLATRFSMARISWLQKATCTSMFVYLHRHQHHCFQFHLPLQYGRHLRLLPLRLPLLLFLGVTVLLYWARCFLLYLDFLWNV